MQCALPISYYTQAQYREDIGSAKPTSEDSYLVLRKGNKDKYICLFSNEHRQPNHIRATNNVGVCIFENTINCNTPKRTISLLLTM